MGAFLKAFHARLHVVFDNGALSQATTIILDPFNGYTEKVEHSKFFGNFRGVLQKALRFLISC